MNPPNMNAAIPERRPRDRGNLRCNRAGHIPQRRQRLLRPAGVLGRYQSDPRYIFRFDGLDGHISVKTEDYRGRAMPEADKVGIETFGLGTSPKGHRVIVHVPEILVVDVVSTPTALGQLQGAWQIKNGNELWSPRRVGPVDRRSVGLRRSTSRNFPHQ